MQTDVPNWREQLAKGNFKDIGQWLSKNVHNQGKLHDPPALVKRITGKELTVKPYLNYLNQKYSELYGF
jgi:carboxypeptidase Taq